MTCITKVLENLHGTGFIGLDSTTVVKQLPGGKKNEYQGRVTKVTTGISAMVYENKFVNGYENMVRRRLQESGIQAEFNVGSLPWGTKVENTPIITHKGKAYLQLIVRNVGDVQYQVDGVNVDKITDSEGVEWLVDADGNTLTQLPRKYTSKGQGGLSDEERVIICTYSLDSITELRAYKETYHSLSYNAA